MSTAKDIEKCIKELTSKMISIGFCDDQNYPSYNKTGIIEEVGLKTTNNPIFLKSIPYKEMYDNMCKEKLFNIRMIDGALIQMQYRFIRGEIVKHRLAFFPSPDLEAYQNDPELYFEDEMYAEVIDQKAVTVPLRFDFDDGIDDNGSKISQPVIHPVSHLTIGEYKNCRIPVYSAVTPSQFIKFVVMNFYNTAYNKIKIDFSDDGIIFESTIFDEEKRIIHICNLTK